MESTFVFYAKFVGLFAVLMLMVGINLGTWGLHGQPTKIAWHVHGADAEHGRRLLHDYSCGACHVVRGAGGATGRLGPPLSNLDQQMYVAGVLPNTPPNLALWIQSPEKAKPRTAMPNLGVTDEDALDIAAYLYRGD